MFGRFLYKIRNGSEIEKNSKKTYKKVIVNNILPSSLTVLLLWGIFTLLNTYFRSKPVYREDISIVVSLIVFSALYTFISGVKRDYMVFSKVHQAIKNDVFPIDDFAKKNYKNIDSRLKIPYKQLKKDLFKVRWEQFKASVAKFYNPFMLLSSPATLTASVDYCILVPDWDINEIGYANVMLRSERSLVLYGLFRSLVLYCPLIVFAIFDINLGYTNAIIWVVYTIYYTLWKTLFTLNDAVGAYATLRDIDSDIARARKKREEKKGYVERMVELESTDFNE